ncbi:MAG: hypothetical protein J1E29_07645, partial [Duncaniella sp.]|nr:hypothetical protein [Duncaniella sp.]
VLAERINRHQSANSNDEKMAPQINEDAVEKSSGHSLSLNDYIRKHYEKAYGNGNVDGRFKELCEVGYEYGQAVSIAKIIY